MYLLLFFCGAAAARFGLFVLFVCIVFGQRQDKLAQFVPSLFLEAVAVRKMFVRFYLELKNILLRHPFRGLVQMLKC